MGSTPTASCPVTLGQLLAQSDVIWPQVPHDSLEPQLDQVRNSAPARGHKSRVMPLRVDSRVLPGAHASRRNRRLHSLRSTLWLLPRSTITSTLSSTVPSGFSHVSV